MDNFVGEVMRLFIIFLMLCAINFLYQINHNKDYTAALERSYFQGIALIAVWLSGLVK
jgi:hypothetical protein